MLFGNGEEAAASPTQHLFLLTGRGEQWWSLGRFCKQ